MHRVGGGGEFIQNAMMMINVRKLPGATLWFFSFRFANFKVGKINFKVGKINFKVGKINFNVDKFNFKVGKINFKVGLINFLMSVKSTFLCRKNQL